MERDNLSCFGRSDNHRQRTKQEVSPIVDNPRSSYPTVGQSHRIDVICLLLLLVWLLGDMNWLSQYLLR
jgi:hypothetical protein